jgi:hypothetical protein
MHLILNGRITNETTRLCVIHIVFRASAPRRPRAPSAARNDEPVSLVASGSEGERKRKGPVEKGASHPGRTIDPRDRHRVSIDDTVTRNLMLAYYDQLARGGGRSEVLREQQLTCSRGPRQHVPATGQASSSRAAAPRWTARRFRRHAGFDELRPGQAGHARLRLRARATAGTWPRPPRPAARRDHPRGLVAAASVAFGIPVRPVARSSALSPWGSRALPGSPCEIPGAEASLCTSARKRK